MHTWWQDDVQDDFYSGIFTQGRDENNDEKH